MNKLVLILPLLMLAVLLGYFGTSLLTEQGYALIAIVLIAVIVVAVFLSLKCKKGNEKMN